MRILAIVAHLLCELVSAHRTYAESSLDKRAFSFELLNPVPELYVGPFPCTSVMYLHIPTELILLQRP